MSNSGTPAPLKEIISHLALGGPPDSHAEAAREAWAFLESLGCRRFEPMPVNDLLASREQFLGDILHSSQTSLSLRKVVLLGELGAHSGFFSLRDSSGRIRVRIARLRRLERCAVVSIRRFRLICPVGEENYLEVSAEDIRVFSRPMAKAAPFAAFNMADPLTQLEQNEMWRLHNPLSIQDFKAIKRHKTNDVNIHGFVTAISPIHNQKLLKAGAQSEMLTFLVRLSSKPLPFRELDVAASEGFESADTSLELSFFGAECTALRSILTLNDHGVFVGLKRSKLLLNPSDSTSFRYVLALDDSGFRRFEFSHLPHVPSEPMIHSPDSSEYSAERPSKRPRLLVSQSQSSQRMSLPSDDDPQSDNVPLISFYSGVITRIKSAGLWELDHGSCSVLLCHILLPSQDRIGFRIGSRIRISHAHLSVDGSDHVTLCCCPVSTIELVEFSTDISITPDHRHLNLLPEPSTSLARFDFRTALWFYEVAELFKVHLWHTDLSELCGESGIFDRIANLNSFRELPVRMFFAEFLSHFDISFGPGTCTLGSSCTATFPKLLTPSILHDELLSLSQDYQEFLKRMAQNELAIDPENLFLPAVGSSFVPYVLLGFITVDSSVPPIYSLADDALSLPILVPAAKKLPQNLNDLLYVTDFSVVVDSLSSYRGANDFSPTRSLSLALNALDRIPITNHKEFVSQFGSFDVSTQARIRGEFLFSQPPEFLQAVKRTPVVASAKPIRRVQLAVSMAKVCAADEINSQSVVSVRGRIVSRNFEVQDSLFSSQAIQYVKLHMVIADDSGLDSIQVYIAEAVSLDRFFGIVPGSEVALREVIRHVTAKGKFYLSFTPDSAVDLLDFPRPGPSPSVDRCLLKQHINQLYASALDPTQGLDARSTQMSVTLTQVIEIILQWRCNQCGGVVKNSVCVDRGCKRGAALQLELLARASDGTGTATLVFGPHCVEHNLQWSLLDLDEKVVEALFRFVQLQGRIKYYNGSLFASGVKADVDESKSKMDEVIILKAFNRFASSAVPMTLVVAVANSFKHIRKEMKPGDFIADLKQERIVSSATEAEDGADEPNSIEAAVSSWASQLVVLNVLHFERRSAGRLGKALLRELNDEF